MVEGIELFQLALLQLFEQPKDRLLDEAYQELLDKGLNIESTPKKRSKSKLSFLDDVDLPEPQSSSNIAASLKEINSVLVPNVKGSKIRHDPILSSSITIEQFRLAYYKITQLELPDSFSSRFIRARKGHLRKALDMMIKGLKFQIIFQVESIRMHGDSILPRSELLGKAYIYHSDNDGRPVLYINTAQHDKNKCTTCEFEEVCIFVMETLRCFVRSPVSNIVLVFNMTGFGMSNMDNNLTKFIAACAQDYYPESLHKCYVVNAPWIFNSIWRIIKGWLDPVVQSKVEFCTDEELRALVPNVPKDLNPESNYTFEFVPPSKVEENFVKNQDKKALQRALDDYLDAVKQYEICTVKWIRTMEKSEPVSRSSAANRLLRKSSTHSSMDSFVSANSEDELIGLDLDLNRTKQEWAQLRFKLIQEMHTRYTVYDRIMRCPTTYHRAGVIRREGKRDELVWE